MNNHHLMLALEQLEAAKIATIDQKERDAIEALAVSVDALLRSHGIFIGRD